MGTEVHPYNVESASVPVRSGLVGEADGHGGPSLRVIKERLLRHFVLGCRAWDAPSSQYGPARRT